MVCGVWWECGKSISSVSLMVGSDGLPSPLGRDWHGLPHWGVWVFTSVWDGSASHITPFVISTSEYSQVQPCKKMVKKTVSKRVPKVSQ